MSIFNEETPILRDTESWQDQKRRVDADGFIFDTSSHGQYLRIALLISDRNGTEIGKDYAQEHVAYDAWFFKWRVKRAKARLLKRRQTIAELRKGKS